MSAASSIVLKMASTGVQSGDPEDVLVLGKPAQLGTRTTV